jgi:hypothetical protein
MNPLLQIMASAVVARIRSIRGRQLVSIDIFARYVPALDADVKRDLVGGVQRNCFSLDAFPH